MLKINDFNAAKIRQWIKERGGISVWHSVDLSDPSREWITAARDESGEITKRPSWKCANTPASVITDESQIEVTTCREVKRFHVAIRTGSQGFSLKCTDASSEKIRCEVDKAGEGAYYEFDYETQEAVIFAPEKTVPLTKWKEEESCSLSGVK